MEYAQRIQCISTCYVKEALPCCRYPFHVTLQSFIFSQHSKNKQITLSYQRYTIPGKIISFSTSTSNSRYLTLPLRKSAYIDSNFSCIWPFFIDDYKLTG